MSSKKIQKQKAIKVKKLKKAKIEKDAKQNIKSLLQLKTTKSSAKVTAKQILPIAYSGERSVTSKVSLINTSKIKTDLLIKQQPLKQVSFKQVARQVLIRKPSEQVFKEILNKVKLNLNQIPLSKSFKTSSSTLSSTLNQSKSVVEQIRFDSASLAKLKKKKLNKKTFYHFKKVKRKDVKFIDQTDIKNHKQTCRICFASKCDKKTGDLIIPCNCRGIFATVHEKCISDWIVAMCSETCDICRFKFLINAKHKNLIDFIIEEHQFHYIWRFLTIMLFSIYLILIVAAFVQFVEKHSYMNEFFVLIYKSSCSVLVFSLLCYVGYYFIERLMIFRQWRKYKYHVKVKLNPASKSCRIDEIVTPPPDILRSSGIGQISIKPFFRTVF